MGKILQIHPEDNVGIVIEPYDAGEVLDGVTGSVILATPLHKGERIALGDIAEQDGIFQYGCEFAASKGIRAGEKITLDNTVYQPYEGSRRFLYSENEHKQYVQRLNVEAYAAHRSFYGYQRFDGRVGTRNYYIILPLSQCASDVAVKIGMWFSGKKYKGIDGIISLPHTEGCGCTRRVQIERVLDVFLGFVSHPNVGKVLAIELGCEQTNIERIKSVMSERGMQDYAERVDFLSIEGIGGTLKAIAEGVNIIQRKLSSLEHCQRTLTTINKLIVGTECGGSDAFSGITANRLIGKFADYIVDHQGSVILSEIPEMIGAEQSIIRRCRNGQVARKFAQTVLWYEEIARRLGETISDNLVKENINGGLINPAIKSLGAIVKGGTRPVMDVLSYGEKLCVPGLNIMQGPGNDMESVTGMAASGANLICFSTGKGTVTGSAIVPVVKVSSTSDVFRKMADDMDYDGEKMFAQMHIEQYINEFIDLAIRVASGELTKSEMNDQRQFQIWTAGKLSV